MPIVLFRDYCDPAVLILSICYNIDPAAQAAAMLSGFCDMVHTWLTFTTASEHTVSLERRTAHKPAAIRTLVDRRAVETLLFLDAVGGQHILTDGSSMSHCD